MRRRHTHTPDKRPHLLHSPQREDGAADGVGELVVGRRHGRPGRGLRVADPEQDAVLGGGQAASDLVEVRLLRGGPRRNADGHCALKEAL